MDLAGARSAGRQAERLGASWLPDLASPGSIWLPLASLVGRPGLDWLDLATPDALAGSNWRSWALWLARFGCSGRSWPPWLVIESQKTFSFSIVCLDAACLVRACFDPCLPCLVRSGSQRKPERLAFRRSLLRASWIVDLTLILHASSLVVYYFGK